MLTFFFVWCMSIFTQIIAEKCSLPSLPDFSLSITTKKDEYEEGERFYYRCVKNYHFEKLGTDKHKIECVQGQWATKPFWKCTDDCQNKCQHGSCEKTMDLTTSKTVASCVCHKNYAGENCDARVCETLPLKPHHHHPYPTSGSLRNGKFPLRSYVTFSCMENYVISGDQNHAFCKPGGWDPPIPDCVESFCLSTDVVHGSHTPIKNSYSNSDTIHFKCQQGYSLSGISSSTCVNGKWSTPLPVCRASLSCDRPPQIRFGRIVGSNRVPFTVGRIVQYRCVEGYIIDGRDKIRCGSTGGVAANWSPHPRCINVMKACGKRKIMRRKEDGQLYCDNKGPLITTTLSSTVKPLTIVTATAGALLLLLLIVISLVAYQRRRIALSNRRQDRAQHYAETDRFSFVYYTNDVHVVLPSYDEAMGVQGAPPPYGGSETSVNSYDNADNDQIIGSDCNQENSDVVPIYNPGQMTENHPPLSSVQPAVPQEASGCTSESNINKDVDSSSMNIDDLDCDDTAQLISD